MGPAYGEAALLGPPPPLSLSLISSPWRGPRWGALTKERELGQLAPDEAADAGPRVDADADDDRLPAVGHEHLQVWKV